ncbi:hypothetical protein PYCCODRAFT_1466699 [Trametes coccinea BRFM310]|uniref:BTB domain-containing protein n=1 Tax=Trametes coccinea (strain BRFM310) TaxID=1353009 RepID=A0A1Y2IUB4_TRAC3|nr:hypothetical protein PYCCODRAFT_1466699 [Trametes coccinea BRFM310]
MATLTATDANAASSSGQVENNDGPIALVGNPSTTNPCAEEAQTESPEAERKVPQPDAEFWFEDGNLILVARDVEFRVYRGPLVANSPVFKDLLHLPHSSTNRCTCGGGIALLHVQDSPEDLRHLLRVVMPGKTPRIASDADSFHAVSACIRLGLKYNIVYIVERSLEYLKNYFVYQFRSHDRTRFPLPPSFENIHCIGVVNLARMTGTDVLLAPALMACCLLGASELMNGFAREDGTREVLSNDDIGRCFVGRAALVEATILFMLNISDQTLSSGCTRPSRCKKVFLCLLNNTKHQNNLGTFSRLSWYCFFYRWVESQDFNRRLCWPCCDMLRNRENQLHDDTWRRLPELMGLSVQSWAEEYNKGPRETWRRHATIFD